MLHLLLVLYCQQVTEVKAPAEPASRYPAADRIVAMGDVHGDLKATKNALRLGGLIDAQDNWSGGATVLVQTGDQLDRGGDERAILHLFQKLTKQASAAGGAVHVLNGNHELMNVAGDFRYVTPAGYADFQSIRVDGNDPKLAKLPPEQRARRVAMRPGGTYALLMAKRNTIVIIGDTVFLHGGVLPELARYGIEKFNREVRGWLRGERDQPKHVRGELSPVWSRHYSLDVDADDCLLLAEALTLLHAKRMVVGHTVQNQGINAGCNNQVWRIDVGMAAAYEGSPAVLEIKGAQIKVLH